MFTDIRKKRIDGRTDAGEIPLRKALLPAALMIREQYAKVSYIPSAYSYQGSCMRMVAICGPIVTHRAPCGSYMQRELYAALHHNLHFIDSQVLMPELKEDDAELDLGLAQLLQQRRRRRRTPRRVWTRP